MAKFSPTLLETSPPLVARNTDNNYTPEGKLSIDPNSDLRNGPSTNTIPQVTNKRFVLKLTGRLCNIEQN